MKSDQQKDTCTECNQDMPAKPRCNSCGQHLRDPKPEMIRDKSLPFFTYGLFKPGEFSYPIISEFVDESRIKIVDIEGSLGLRDGLLIYNNTPGIKKVSGYCLHFKEGESEMAYEKIEELEPRNHYTCIIVDGMNVLEGKKPERALDSSAQTDSIEEFHGTKVWGWNDPFFKKGFRLLDTDFHFDGGKLYPHWVVPDENAFDNYIVLQMKYLYLFSMIERFSFLIGNLGMGPNQRVKQLAIHPMFHQSVEVMLRHEDFAYIEEEERKRVIYSSEDLKNYPCNFENPVKLMLFYYQLRNNISHRGKGVSQHVDLFERYFNEIFFIFRTMFNLMQTESESTKARIDELIESKQ